MRGGVWKEEEDEDAVDTRAGGEGNEPHSAPGGKEEATGETDAPLASAGKGKGTDAKGSTAKGKGKGKGKGKATAARRGARRQAPVSAFASDSDGSSSAAEEESSDGDPGISKGRAWRLRQMKGKGKGKAKGGKGEEAEDPDDESSSEEEEVKRPAKPQAKSAPVLKVPKGEQTGEIRQWRQKRKFGFLRADSKEYPKDIFFHFQSIYNTCGDVDPRPELKVKFEIGCDRSGKVKALWVLITDPKWEGNADPGDQAGEKGKSTWWQESSWRPEGSCNGWDSWGWADSSWSQHDGKRKADAEAAEEPRPRVKAKTQAAHSSGVPALAASPPAAPAVPSVPAPEKALPEGWQKMESKSRPGTVYYYNARTGQSVFDIPPA